VIIPCFNAGKTLAFQLQALAEQSWNGPWEVILADNGSTDDSREIAEKFRDRLPGIRVIDASARRGQPFALNAGVAAATGDTLLFCDADDEVGSGWLAAMAEALTAHDFVACRIDAAKLNSPEVRASREGTQRDGLQRFPYPPYLPHAGGGTIGVKRKLHLAVNGFDEELPATHDTLYCLQIQLLGPRLEFVPNATMHVRFRGDYRGMFRQARTYGFYSTLVYKKAMELGTVPIAHPWRDAAEVWRDLLKRLRYNRRKEEWTPWVFRVGYRTGRLLGSICHGVVAP
jgi:glycosyltransferase involved in cell wall biosynthesis